MMMLFTLAVFATQCLATSERPAGSPASSPSAGSNRLLRGFDRFSVSDSSDQRLSPSSEQRFAMEQLYVTLEADWLPQVQLRGRSTLAKISRIPLESMVIWCLNEGLTSNAQRNEFVQCLTSKIVPKVINDLGCRRIHNDLKEICTPEELLELSKSIPAAQRFLQEEISEFQGQHNQRIVEAIHFEDIMAGQRIPFDDVIANIRAEMPVHVLPPGLSDAELERIPVVSLEESGVKSADQPNARCGICYDDFDHNSQIKHIGLCGCVCKTERYHDACISTWLKREAKCPTCKEDITVQVDPLDGYRQDEVHFNRGNPYRNEEF